MNTIQKIGSVLFLCTVNAITGLSQDHTAEIQQLLTTRNALAHENQSYASVEREIAALGQLPPALVTKSVAAGKTTFEFTAYKNIQPEKEQIIAQRIVATISNTESVVISSQHITAVFSAAATEANMTDFFKLMGYTSYEIKN